MMQHLNKTLVMSGILLAALSVVVFQIISGSGTTALAVGPDESPTNEVTWGPSYDDDDLIVEPERGRAELELMRNIDRRALNHQRLSPSYDGNETIIVAGPKVNVSNGVAWGPSYSGDDTVQNRPELDMMHPIDAKALRGVMEGPSYRQ